MWIQITYDVRVKIEKLFKKGKSAREIALCVGYSTRTIQRELKRGMIEVTYTKYDELAKVAPDMKREYITKTEYSAQIAENEHVEKSSGVNKYFMSRLPIDYIRFFVIL